MTKIFFIRHAQADSSVRDPLTRPLTPKGVADRRLVTEYLQDKNIEIVLSSPFKRAVDTIADFAAKNNLEIEIVENFRERKSDSDWNREMDYDSFNKHQWEDFSYTLSDGECIAKVQERNIESLNEVLSKYKNKSIVIGTHGMALSAIINYYDNTYGLNDFMNMLFINPWVVKMSFNGYSCVAIEKIDLFAL